MVSTTPRLLYPQEIPGTHCTGGWVSPRADKWTCEKNLAPTGIQYPDRPVQCIIHISGDFRIVTSGCVCERRWVPDVWNYLASWRPVSGRTLLYGVLIACFFQCLHGETDEKI
jgi:hypothetical protein